MNIRRYAISITAAAALSVYILAVWCETACYASAIEFNELLTRDKMLPAFGAVRWHHINKLDYIDIPMEISGRERAPSKGAGRR